MIGVIAIGVIGRYVNFIASKIKFHIYTHILMANFDIVFYMYVQNVCVPLKSLLCILSCILSCSQL